MSSEQYSPDFFKGPAYALVIGISKYLNGQQPDVKLEPKNFPDLNFAHTDAGNFAQVLMDIGAIEYNVKSLLNEEATYINIKVELHELVKRCREDDANNPLVIIYFSGHGWADPEVAGENRPHYLIPYDARRDQLDATALSNESFSATLKKMKTNRLVVFLDACHSGAMAAAGQMGPIAEYSPTLGAGEGRYVIASCGPNQSSWEWEDEKRGIFTGHLLEILKGEADEIKDEEIDIFTLFPALRKRVKETAARLHKPEQEPVSEIEGGRKIILAINKGARAARIAKDEKDREAERNFFDLICIEIKKSTCGQKAILKEKLRSYVDEDRKDRGYDDFYDLFDEYRTLFLKGNPKLEDCVVYLVKVHERVINSAVPPKEIEFQEPAKPVDKFVPAAETKILGTEKLNSPRAPSQSADQQTKRRELTKEDRDYILIEIATKLVYYKDATPLLDALSQPVSEGDFVSKVHEIRLRKKDDAVLVEILYRITERFQERFSGAAVFVPKTVSDVRFEKGKEGE